LDRKNLKQKTDEEIARLVPKDKECFAVLIERYEGKLSRYVRRFQGGNVETVEDIVQNIFIKAYVHTNSLKDGQKFSSWIYRIAHNESIDYWRKHKKYAGSVSLEYNAELVSSISAGGDLAEELAVKGEQKEVADLIEKLPLKYKEVLVLRYLEDKDYEEMAEILKRPTSTVGTLLRRAKAVLKKIIQES
jgi:RNA polymerase sigma-70 factor (ECF subfamily)